MIQKNDFVIYTRDSVQYPAIVVEVVNGLSVNLDLLSPYVGIFNDVPFSPDRLENTWFKPEPLTYHIESTPSGSIEIVPDLTGNIQKDDPKSDFYEVPPQGKNPVYSLAGYWYNLVGSMPLGSQLKAASKIIDQFDYETGCRIVKYYAPKKYTLNWLAKNTHVVRRDFGL